MATLTTEEMARIKAECFDNVLSVGAEPYLSVRALYDVIQANVESSSTAATSSSTTVSAAGPTTLTLASVSGLAAGYKVQIDSDAQRETVSVRAVSGLTISVLCRKTHSGTYPVELESALTLVRGVLSDLSALEQVTTLDAFNSLGLKRVDEVEWSDGGASLYVERARKRLRMRLASLCGLSGILRSASPSAFEVY